MKEIDGKDLKELFGNVSNLLKYYILSLSDSKSYVITVVETVIFTFINTTMITSKGTLNCRQS